MCCLLPAAPACSCNKTGCKSVPLARSGPTAACSTRSLPAAFQSPFTRPSVPHFHSNRRDGSTNQQDVGIKLAQNGKQTRRVVKSTCPTKRWTNRTMEDGEKKSKHGRRGQRHTRLHSSRHSACLNPPSLLNRPFIPLTSVWLACPALGLSVLSACPPGTPRSSVWLVWTVWPCKSTVYCPSQRTPLPPPIRPLAQPSSFQAHSTSVLLTHRHTSFSQGTS